MSLKLEEKRLLKKGSLFSWKGLKLLFASDESTIIFIFLAIVLAVSVLVPDFRSSYNILVVLRQFSTITIVAMGQAIVVISGTFDLSVGSIVALSGMFGTYLAVTMQFPVILSVFLAVALGGLCGLINGLLVAKLKINSIIATLASGWIFTGVILITTKGWPISDFPRSFAYLGQGYLLGLPLPVLYMLILTLLLALFMGKTIIGRNFYAIGGNPTAGFFAGLNVNRYRILAYVICGALAGFAGIVLSARVGSAQARAAAEWALPSVAAGVIGGVSLSGGKGKIFGVLIGSALLGIINNILVLIQVSAYWQSLISGLVLLVAVALDSYRRSGNTV
jgi:ribose transport system permease protein